MNETNLIVYAVREGYEIKTWIKADETESDSVILQRAKEKFEEVGVELKDNEEFELEWYN